MERKYGQRGYQDSGAPEREHSRENAPKPKPKGGPKGSNRDIPRQVHMPGFQEVMRCSLCGVIIPPPFDIQFDSQCPKCKADLRACKNCRHFDTGAQFECTQPIKERIVKKDVRNQCTFFVQRTSIERETRAAPQPPAAQSAPSPRPSDARSARSAFDDLFKK